MRNQIAKQLHEGRGGHYSHRVHGETPRRRPSKQELLEEALIQDDLLDEAFNGEDNVSE